MQQITQRPVTASGPFTIGGDMTVYRLGFGAMRLTGPGIWGPPADKQEAIAVLHRALEPGMNLLDTADSYGPGVSERTILPIPGTSSVKYLEENTVGATIRLSQEEFDAIDRAGK